MTEDDEHELFRQLRRLNRRTSIIGALAIAGAALLATTEAVRMVKEQWGWTDEWGFWLAGAPIGIAVWWWLARDFDRD